MGEARIGVAGSANMDLVAVVEHIRKGTMDFVIHRHGEIALAFGLLALATWWLARRSRAGRRPADALVRRASAATCALIALQGLVGLDQYKTHLPTELVWVHVSLASLTWVSVLWTACAAGRLQPRVAPSKEPETPEKKAFSAYSPEIRA